MGVGVVRGRVVGAVSIVRGRVVVCWCSEWDGGVLSTAQGLGTEEAGRNTGAAFIQARYETLHL